MIEQAAGQVLTQAIGRLERLAETDPTVASLARLQADALRAATDSSWDEGVPDLDRSQAERGVPLLHQQTLRADAGRVRRLLVRLSATARRHPGIADDATAIGRAAEQGDLDLTCMLAAAVAQDGGTLARLAEAVDVDAGLLATLGQLAVLPLLQACGRRADALLKGIPWTAGSCPVCAAWPALSELRGLDRTRWLRCGRCGAGWSVAHVGCPYCGTADQRSSSYLAPERERESRRAVTCEVCRGYLKALTTIQPISPAEIGLLDIQTLELDVAALEQGYGRPDGPGFPLGIAVDLTKPRSRWTFRRR